MEDLDFIWVQILFENWMEATTIILRLKTPVFRLGRVVLIMVSKALKLSHKLDSEET